MNDGVLKFRYGPGKIVFRPIISQDETMTIYGKEQELGECKEMTQISETVDNNSDYNSFFKEENENE